MIEIEISHTNFRFSFLVCASHSEVKGMQNTGVLCGVVTRPAVDWAQNTQEEPLMTKGKEMCSRFAPNPNGLHIVAPFVIRLSLRRRQGQLI